jgi:hypothetical protein
VQNSKTFAGFLRCGILNSSTSPLALTTITDVILHRCFGGNQKSLFARMEF